MPRYFFDLYNDMDVLDEEGRDLPDLAAAKADVLKEARAMIQASVTEVGEINLQHHIDVRDQAGAVLHILYYEDAVSIRRGPDVISRTSH